MYVCCDIHMYIYIYLLPAHMYIILVVYNKYIYTHYDEQISYITIYIYMHLKLIAFVFRVGVHYLYFASNSFNTFTYCSHNNFGFSSESLSAITPTVTVLFSVIIETPRPHY